MTLPFRAGLADRTAAHTRAAAGLTFPMPLLTPAETHSYNVCAALLAAVRTYKAHKNTGFVLATPQEPPCIYSPIYRDLKQAYSKTESNDW